MVVRLLAVHHTEVILVSVTHVLTRYCRLEPDTIGLVSDTQPPI